ncbi:MAG: XRE family transcriptional regulator [Defluviitaleaceae bacterium]|nr:XRE family transcriptional regulator [Defluviitaleaceae bacterium]
MTEQLREIGFRLSALRKIAEMAPEEFCGKMGVTQAELAAYEKGERDFSFSFLYNAARILGVDVIDLMSGDSPRLSDWCIVRKGEGYAIDRRTAYKYSHLAFTFRDKKAEPFLVTVLPKESPPAMHDHDGQEFNWMVSGRLRFHISDSDYVLEPGDSVYFDASIPHAIQAMDGKPAELIAVVMG